MFSAMTWRYLDRCLHNELKFLLLYKAVIRRPSIWIAHRFSSDEVDLDGWPLVKHLAALQQSGVQPQQSLQC